MSEHDLKTWPEPFAALLDGRKTFEIRRNDRDYQVGDVLVLREYEPPQWIDNVLPRPLPEHFTGRVVRRRVTYMVHGGAWGIPPDLCVMGIADEEDQERKRGTTMKIQDHVADGMQHAEKRLEMLLAETQRLQKRGRLHNHPTREEYISFAYGNVALHNPNVTKEMVEQAAEEFFARKPKGFFFRPETCERCKHMNHHGDEQGAIAERASMDYEPKRDSFKSIYMSLALMLAGRSTCVRLHVGTVITTTDYRKVLAVGYNGNAAGQPNICDRTGEDGVGNCGCLHSEENAIINCDAPRATPKIVFVTHLPCVMCAKRLINLGGVKLVVWDADYRIKDSLGLLESAGIDNERIARPAAPWGLP